MNLQQIKQRFAIIGNAYPLNRALEVATQVAPTDLSVLVTGESGTGKEIIPQVIHQLSARKHKEYIAALFLKGPLIQNYLGTKKDLLQEPQAAVKDILKSPTEEQFSWMRSPNSPWPLKLGY